MSMRIDPSFGLTFPDGSQQSSAALPKDLLINGRFLIDQWNQGGPVSTGVGVDTFVCDRWFLNASGAAVNSQRLGTPGAYYLRFSSTSGNTGFTFGQRLEANDVASLVGKSITVSFSVSSPSLTSGAVSIDTPAFTDSGYSSPTLGSAISFSILPTPQRISRTFTVPSGATKGMQLAFRFPAFPVGNLIISDVQLEVGTSASSLERQTYSETLFACQRYFWYMPQPTFDTLNKNYAASSGTLFPAGAYKFPATMRVAPTAAASNISYYNCSALASNGTTQDFAVWTVSTAAANMYSARFASTYNAEIY